jgi:hypothetical protein
LDRESESKREGPSLFAREEVKYLGERLRRLSDEDDQQMHRTKDQISPEDTQRTRRVSQKSRGRQEQAAELMTMSNVSDSKPVDINSANTDKTPRHDETPNFRSSEFRAPQSRANIIALATADSFLAELGREIEDERAARKIAPLPKRKPLQDLGSCINSEVTRACPNNNPHADPNTDFWATEPNQDETDSPYALAIGHPPSGVADPRIPQLGNKTPASISV